MPRAKTHEQYVTQCQEKGYDLPMSYGDCETSGFDLSLLPPNNRYVTDRVKLLHKCKVEKHLPYPQAPSKHSRGQKCSSCSGVKHKTDAEYRQECQEKGLDPPLDRDDNRYRTAKDELFHVCSVTGHPPYSHVAYSHLQGAGCPICGGTQQKTHEQYMKECVDGDFDLPVENYVTTHVPIKHKCRKCNHLYPQDPASHRKGAGCSKCSGRIRTDADYRQICMERNYDPPVDSDTNRYAGSTTPLLHKCRKEHRDYLQRPANHLQGAGCQLCVRKTEALLVALLDRLGYKIDTEKWFEWLRTSTRIRATRAGRPGLTTRPRRFDIYIPALRLFIELDGPHHFASLKFYSVKHPEQIQIDTFDKMVPALRNGYSILRIPQAEYLACPTLYEPAIEQVLRAHNPEEVNLLTIGFDLSIYEQHIEFTTLYYDNPEIVPEPTTNEESDLSDDEEL